jgi:CheY-like chemotaxis protein
MNTSDTLNINPSSKINSQTVNKRKTFNILIIDDDTTVAESLKDYLEFRGHTVCTVDEGTRGLYQLSTRSFDIIFVDYHLDNDSKKYFDGVVMTDCIRGKIKYFIFGYTGDTSKETIDKCKAVGMDGVVFKPMDINTLDKLFSHMEQMESINKRKLKFSKDNLIIF